MILLYDNIIATFQYEYHCCHNGIHVRIQSTIMEIVWKFLYVSYSPGTPPSDYYLFSFVQYSLSSQYFQQFQDIKKFFEGFIKSECDSLS